MNFTILFKCVKNLHYYKNPVCLEKKNLGLDAVDSLRNHFSTDFDCDIISDTIDAVCDSSIKINISENAARKSGRFLKNNSIVILVPDSFLNQFYQEDPKLWGGDLPTSCRTVGIEFKFDIDLFLDYWSLNNFKLEF